MGKIAKGYLRKNKSVPCCFCHSTIDSEQEYGAMYTINSITCHYFCLLFSTTLIQSGKKDNDGILGFLFTDIRRELRDSQGKKCIYCNLNMASVHCCHRSCRKKFHVSCGVKNGALFLFYKTFQSFCVDHRVNQNIPKYVLANRKIPAVLVEKINQRDNKKYKKCNNNLSFNISRDNTPGTDEICTICYESVVPYPLVDTFWPPCCKGNQWFHRNCLKKLAQSVGEYFLRCPLCNNTSKFIDALYKFGIYIPSRDASWELERGAFSELLERPNACCKSICLCPKGRSFSTSKTWQLAICKSCGSEAVHWECANITKDVYECNSCSNIVRSFNNKNSTIQFSETDLEDAEVEICEVEKPHPDFSFDEKPSIFAPDSEHLSHITSADCDEENVCDIKKEFNENKFTFAVLSTYGVENLVVNPLHNSSGSNFSVIQDTNDKKSTNNILCKSLRSPCNSITETDKIIIKKENNDEIMRGVAVTPSNTKNENKNIKSNLTDKKLHSYKEESDFNSSISLKNIKVKGESRVGEHLKDNCAPKRIEHLSNYAIDKYLLFEHDSPKPRLSQISISKQLKKCIDKKILPNDIKINTINNYFSAIDVKKESLNANVDISAHTNESGREIFENDNNCNSVTKYCNFVKKVDAETQTNNIKSKLKRKRPDVDVILKNKRKKMKLSEYSDSQNVIFENVKRNETKCSNFTGVEREINVQNLETEDDSSEDFLKSTKFKVINDNSLQINYKKIQFCVELS